MLTHKQLWRRTKPFTNKVSRKINGSQTSQISVDLIDSPVSETEIEPVIIPSDVVESNISNEDLRGLAASNGIDNRAEHLSAKSESMIAALRDSSNNSNNEGFDIKKRNVSFNSLVRVCLVPSRCEYSPITNELYWRHDDYASFKQEAVTELRAYWKEHPSSIKEAITALYQPTLEEVHESYRTISRQDKPSGDFSRHTRPQQLDTNHGPHNAMLGLRSRDSVAKFAGSFENMNEIIGTTTVEESGSGAEVGMCLEEEEDHTDVEEDSLLIQQSHKGSAAVAASSRLYLSNESYETGRLCGGNDSGLSGFAAESVRCYAAATHSWQSRSISEVR